MIGIYSLVRIKVPSSLKYLHSSCQRIPLLIFLTLMAATPNKTSSMAAPMKSECRVMWSVEFVLWTWMSSCKFQNYFDLYMLLWSIDSLKSTVKPVLSDNCVIRFPVTSSIGFHALLTIFCVSLTSCLFRHKTSLLVHFRLDRFHCIFKLFFYKRPMIQIDHLRNSSNKKKIAHGMNIP